MYETTLKSLIASAADYWSHESRSQHDGYNASFLYRHELKSNYGLKICQYLVVGEVGCWICKTFA